MMKRTVLIVAAAVFLGWNQTNLSADLPPLVFPEGVGVNIHFVQGHERDLDMIAAAGFKFIRMDFSWQATEPAKGKYNWRAYDELASNLKRRGMRAVFILDYSNSLYEEAEPTKNPITHKDQLETSAPRHPESIAAFARWAAAGAKHFHDSRVIWEIWNEPNIFFWKPKPNVREYLALALATAREIRQTVPDATIIGPATSTFPWDFLEAFCESGILQNVNAVSVHPYRAKNKPPETASADFERLRKLIDEHAPSGRSIPIISGEWGYSTWSKNVSLDTQAAFIVRQQISNLLNKVPLSIWYDWKNDGHDPAENEQNFGTVTEDLQPKPAYTAIKTFTSELNGCHITKRLPSEKPEDYLIEFQNSEGARKLTCWTTGSKHDVSIPGSNGVATLISWDGKRARVGEAGQPISIEIDEMPVVLLFAGEK
jgi:hypothetical protein